MAAVSVHGHGSTLLAAPYRGCPTNHQQPCHAWMSHHSLDEAGTIISIRRPQITAAINICLSCGATDQERSLSISLRCPHLKAVINICLRRRRPKERSQHQPATSEDKGSHHHLPAAPKATALCHPTSGETAGAPICRGSPSAVKTGDPPSEIRPQLLEDSIRHQTVIGSEI